MSEHQYLQRKNSGRATSLSFRADTNMSSFGLTDNRPKSVIQKMEKLKQNKHGDAAVVQRRTNNTGMPDQLKTGIENLSGQSMDDVKVHYNSSQPGQLNAHAYAQGSDIHLSPGQEKHLPHEAWHVVQQKQGRVKPTMQMKGKLNINDNAGLENEADRMGAKALNLENTPGKTFQKKTVIQ
jgi:hypothetical protein